MGRRRRRRGQPAAALGGGGGAGQLPGTGRASSTSDAAATRGTSRRSRALQRLAAPARRCPAFSGGAGGNPGQAGGSSGGAAGAAIDGVSFVNVVSGSADIRGAQIN